MAVATAVTVTGSNARFILSDSGSGFGIFSSYSAYASEQATFSGDPPSQAAGLGSTSLSLDTAYGSLVISGTDTVGLSDGVFTLATSETLSFVVGQDTLVLASSSDTVGGSSFAALGQDLDGFFSSVLTVGSVIDLPDGIAGSVSMTIASIASEISSMSTTSSTTVQHTLSDNSTISVTRLN